MGAPYSGGDFGRENRRENGPNGAARNNPDLSTFHFDLNQRIVAIADGDLSGAGARIEKLYDLWRENFNDLNQVNVLTFLDRLSRLHSAGADLNDRTRGMAVELGDRITQKFLEPIEPRRLASLLYSLANLRIRDEEVLGRVLEHLENKLATAPSRDLRNISYFVADSNLNPKMFLPRLQELVQRSTKMMVDNAKDLPAADLVGAARSIDIVGLRHDELCLALAKALEGRISELRAPEMRSISLRLLKFGALSRVLIAEFVEILGNSNGSLPAEYKVELESILRKGIQKVEYGLTLHAKEDKRPSYRSQVDALAGIADKGDTEHHKLPAILELLRTRTSEFSPTQLALCTKYLDKLGHKDKDLVQIISQTFIEQMDLHPEVGFGGAAERAPQITPRNMAVLISALANTGYRSEELRNALSSRFSAWLDWIEAHPESMRAADPAVTGRVVATFVWGLARTGPTGESPLLIKLAHFVEPYLDRFSGHDLSLTMLAFRSCQDSCREFLVKISDQVKTRIDECGAEDISYFARGFSGAGITDSELFSVLAKAAKEKLGELNKHSDLSHLALGFSNAGYADEGLYREIAQRAVLFGTRLSNESLYKIFVAFVEREVVESDRENGKAEANNRFLFRSFAPHISNKFTTVEGWSAVPGEVRNNMAAALCRAYLLPECRDNELVGRIVESFVKQSTVHDGENLAQLGSILARNGLFPEELISRLEILSASELAQMKTSTRVYAAYNLARAGRGAPEFFERLCPAAMDELEQLSSKELGLLAWSVVRASGYRVQIEKPVGARSADNLDQVPYNALALSAREAEFLKRLFSVVEERLELRHSQVALSLGLEPLQPYALSQIAWAAGGSRLGTPRLYDFLADGILERKVDLTPEDIAVSLFGFARADYFHQTLFDELDELVARNPRQFPDWTLSQVAQAHALLNVGNPELLDLIQSQAYLERERHSPYSRLVSYRAAAQLASLNRTIYLNDLQGISESVPSMSDQELVVLTQLVSAMPMYSEIDSLRLDKLFVTLAEEYLERIADQFEGEGLANAEVFNGGSLARLVKFVAVRSEYRDGKIAEFGPLFEQLRSAVEELKADLSDYNLISLVAGSAETKLKLPGFNHWALDRAQRSLWDLDLGRAAELATVLAGQGENSGMAFLAIGEIAKRGIVQLTTAGADQAAFQGATRARIYNLSQIVSSFAELGLEDPGLFSGFRVLIEPYVDSLEGKLLGDVAVSFAKLGVKPETLLDGIKDQALLKIGTFSPDTVAALIWAFEKFGEREVVRALWPHAFAMAPGATLSVSALKQLQEVRASAGLALPEHLTWEEKRTA